MDLVKLFKTQSYLYERIEKEHPKDEGEDRLSKRVLALLVELAECANEWRGFKFWSMNQEPRNNDIKCHACKGSGVFSLPNDPFEPCLNCERTGIQERNPLLMEYVDNLHFILDLGIEYEISVTDLRDLHQDEEDSIEKQFIMLNVVTTEIYLTPKENALNDYRDLLSLFLGLGKMLGLTWEQIEEAYYEKNKINHERQATGY